MRIFFVSLNFIMCILLLIFKFFMRIFDINFHIAMLLSDNLVPHSVCFSLISPQLLYNISSTLLQYFLERISLLSPQLLSFLLNFSTIFPQLLSNISPQLPSNISPTSLQHFSNISPTSLRYFSDFSPIFLQLLSNIFPTSL